MADLTIVTVPDPRLRTVCVEVPNELNLKDAKQSFTKCMVDNHGVGLASPQIGILYRMFVMSETAKENDAIFVINPKIVKAYDFGVVGDEGCLSIPGVIIPVKRYVGIDATWKDEKGVNHSKRLEGWVARIFQHEFDHLNGVLISDRYSEQNPDQVV